MIEFGGRQVLPAIGGPARPSPRDGSAPGREARFAEAAKGVEEVFAHHLVSAMRATVPDGGNPSAPGAALYGSLLDQHLASVLARDTRTGIAEAIERQLMPGASPIREDREAEE